MADSSPIGTLGLSVCGLSRDTPDPSEEEIAERCLEVRLGWTIGETHLRSVKHRGSLLLLARLFDRSGG